MMGAVLGLLQGNQQLHDNQQLWSTEDSGGFLQFQERRNAQQRLSGKKEGTLIYAQKSMLLAKSSTWELIPPAIQRLYFIPRF